MKQCIVVADRARARLFSVEDSNDTPFEEGHRHLHEHRDIVNPEGKLTDRELFRDTRGGRRARASVSGGGYGIDDGKNRQRIESARRFAKELATAASELVRSQKSTSLVLVASPKFLGVVRAEVRKSIPKNTTLTELAEDLSWHATARLEQVLTRHGVLDSREPVVAYRPRAQTLGNKKAPRHKKKTKAS
jgi:protein required for attachment to host cells